MVIKAGEGDTLLSLKKLSPVRLLKNHFFEQVQAAEQSCASAEELQTLLGRGRAKKGMFEGELDEGELEIGQIASIIDTVLPVKTIMKQMLDEYGAALNEMTTARRFRF
jgi:enoyl-[acyl-carrier protein] reductase II